MKVEVKAKPQVKTQVQAKDQIEEISLEVDEQRARAVLAEENLERMSTVLDEITLITGDLIQLTERYRAIK
jgi:hypothetical protein